MPKDTGVKISTDRKVETLIRRICQYSYPVERPIYLIGCANDEKIEIKECYIPEDWCKVSTPDMIKWKSQWEKEAGDAAGSLQVVGTLHSHCYDEKTYGKPQATAPSDQDWKSFSHYPCIGICTVYKLNSGKMKTFYRVYPVRKGEMVKV